MTTTIAASEAREQFECFGGICDVIIAGSGPSGSASAAVGRARARLLEWHHQFSRFEPESELSRLNDDPRDAVPVSSIMARFVEVAVRAADVTHGLVDPTLVGEVEQAGYTRDLGLGHAAPSMPTGPAGPRRPGGPHPDARWRQVAVDRDSGMVLRPAGIRLDSGGIAKGLFGDVLAAVLSFHDAFVIAAAGDIRLGGKSGVSRPVEVSNPFEQGSVLHTFGLVSGAVATSGTTKRSWLDERGQVAHHVLDPATGRPAFTGAVQVTAVARTGVEAEALAKAALLAGPEAAAGWLPFGGVVVCEDGSHYVIDPDDRKAGK